MDHWLAVSLERVVRHFFCSPCHVQAQGDKSIQPKPIESDTTLGFSLLLRSWLQVIISTEAGGFTIKGALGITRMFYWDGGMRPMSGTELVRIAREAKASGKAFVLPVDSIPRLLTMVTDTRRTTGPTIPLGSDEELAAIELLELAAESRIPAFRLDSLYSALVAEPTLAHYQEVVNHFDVSQREAFSAYDIARGLRRQRRLGYWKTLN
jgi:hypothetical protein